MNIQDAMKSGKKFRRPVFISGYWCHVCNIRESIYYEDDSYLHISVADILADDWEVEEEKLTITKNELEIALIQYHRLKQYNTEIVWRQLKENQK